MKIRQRYLTIGIAAILIGAVLYGVAAFKRLDDWWGTLGMSMAMVGIIMLVKYIRMKKNAEYAELMEMVSVDERVQFLAGKAWQLAGLVFVQIAAVAVIVCKILGRDDLMLMASSFLCLLLVLYTIAFQIVKRKY